MPTPKNLVLGSLLLALASCTVGTSEPSHDPADVVGRWIDATFSSYNGDPYSTVFVLDPSPARLP